MKPPEQGTSQDLIALDRALVQTLAVGFRTAELYEPDNTVMATVVDRLAVLISRRAETAPFSLGVRNRCVFANGRRVRLAAGDYPRFVYLLRVFDEWSIQGFGFHAPVPTDRLATFLSLVANERNGSAEALADRLETASLSEIEVIEADENDQRVARAKEKQPPGFNRRTDGFFGGPHPDGIYSRGEAPEVAYLRAVTAAQDATESLRQSGRLGARRIRRVTQAIVDQVMRDPTSLLALSTIKDYDIYLISHSINVAILSAMLGQRLGLTKTQLGELVLAAFLHDIGKTQLPDELVGKPAALTDDEWVEMRRHPELGARAILEQQHLTPSMMRALRVAFEHHMNYDLHGYPHIDGLASTSLFARIIMVTDRYDAMTTPRPYRRLNFTPAEAIVAMAAGAGTSLDPVVLRFFVEMMGVYPVGTLVRLANGEVGVVETPPASDAPSNRPLVRLLSDNSSVDLAERDASGVFVNEIAEIVNPGNVGLVPAVGPERLVLDEDTELQMT